MTGRTTVRLALVAGFAALAVGLGAIVVATGDDDAAQRVSTGPPIRSGDEPTVGSALTQPEAEQVVRTVLDPSVDATVAAAAIDADDAAELMVSIRSAAATAGVTSSEVVHVGIEVAEGDRASVDAMLSTGGASTAGTGGVHVRHITLVRKDGTWLMTREAACGIAGGGGMLATPAPCAAPPAVHRVDSVADPLGVMGDLPGTPLVVRWDRVESSAYGSELIAGPAGLVAVEYPGTDVGGGGPVGPVELVRLDPGTGRETGRMRPGGEYATVVVGSEAIWVLAAAPVDPNGSGGWGHFLLTRIDAATFRSTGSMSIDGELGALLAVSGDTAWVHHAGGLQRIEGPDPHVTATVAGVAGTIGDEESLAATGDTVVVQRRIARTGDLLVDADSLESRPVDLPDGQLVSSGDALWVVGTSAQRLDPDAPGAEQPDPVVLPFGGQAVPDGQGGMWLVGELIAGWSDQSWNADALQIAAVRRPVAVHVDAEGGVGTSVVAAGSGTSGAQLRFGAIGSRLALFRGDSVAVYEP